MSRPQVTGDRYSPLRLLGEGGAGRVWLVEDRLHPGTVLALKELSRSSAEHAERLRREFATLATLNHPNLVRVHDFSISPETGLPRFTMESIEGTEILQAIRSGHADTFLHLAAEALRALQFLHDFDLVHRDLKPGNLLVRNAPTSA
jgi:serine/threonine-protein kinase